MLRPVALLLPLLLIVGTVDATPTMAAEMAQLDDEPPAEELPGLGNIIGSPEPGPEPEDPGDRGGWAQLGLAAVLLLAVLFIGSRIAVGLRRAGP